VTSRACGPEREIAEQRPRRGIQAEQSLAQRRGRDARSRRSRACAWRRPCPTVGERRQPGGAEAGGGRARPRRQLSEEARPRRRPKVEAQRLPTRSRNGSRRTATAADDSRRGTPTAAQRWRCRQGVGIGG
jgi:hypothetical protein